MPHLTAVFARNWSVGSVLIRVFGAWGGKWSHVGILDPNTNTILEARYPIGVVETPYYKFISRYSAIETVNCECPEPDKAIDFIRSQLGKKYDWRGIVGFIIKQPIARLNEWFCNEIYEDAFIAGNRRRFRVPSRSITIEQSYRCN
jgi:uncharacterized protein YycO